MTVFPTSRLLFFILVSSLLILCAGCGSYSCMQTARTVDAGQGEVGIGIFYPYGVINAIAQVADKEKKNFTIPYIQVSGKYGLSNQMDIGLNLSTFGQLGIEGKYMLLGDKESLFCLATGAGINTFFFYYYDFHLPVYASIHPLPNLGIYVSPKYIGQFVSLFGLSSRSYFDYMGLSGGVMFGDRIKVGLDITAAFPLGKVYSVEVFPNLYNFGAGIKWTIGKAGESERRSNYRF
ncbi:MAG: hypothetical protein J5I59_07285 [Saprospiraceae bacterium]|nr:hypothetical protein [Saprospiraceae bacterium]